MAQSSGVADQADVETKSGDSSAAVLLRQDEIQGVSHTHGFIEFQQAT
jgi:hypothetical protein